MRQLALDDVEVGAADATRRDAQQDLARLWLGHGNLLLEPQRLAGLVEHHRAHQDIVSSGHGR
jgi:hypothetical protein